MNKKLTGLLTATVLLGLFLGGCSGEKQDIIKVGHKNYTESRLFGQLFSVLLETNTKYKTTVTEFGGSQLVLAALKSGDIDLYPDYTGTLYATVLKKEGEKDPEKVFKMVKEYMEGPEYNFIIGKPFGYNNTYTLSLPQDIAKKYNLEKISDLVTAGPELRMGATMEFLARADGLPGVKKLYGFTFKEEKGMDPGIRYTAIQNGNIDVTDAFSTDGKLKEFNLKSLEDDKNFFPPYYCLTVYNGAFQKNFPGAMEEVEKLAGQISEDDMQEMNFQVDSRGIPERKVAEDFLRKKGLIK
jgi:osmoprotectant transport system substrate-binding protein